MLSWLALARRIQLFGHEFCVRIVETGEGVSRFRAGDRVAARAKLPCENCPLCLGGRNHLCRKGPIIGFQLPGCFSEYAVLPEIALVKVADVPVGVFLSGGLDSSALVAASGDLVFGDPPPLKTCPACLSEDLPAAASKLHPKSKTAQFKG
jgi:hypothetical protein